MPAVSKGTAKAKAVLGRHTIASVATDFKALSDV
jgi:hypothetical protein